MILSLFTQYCYGRHSVSKKSVNHKWFIDILHGAISLPDAMSCDKHVLLKSRAMCFVWYQHQVRFEVQLNLIFSTVRR